MLDTDLVLSQIFAALLYFVF